MMTDPCRKVEDIAIRINDTLAGEMIAQAVIGAVCFASVTAGRNALLPKDEFLKIAAAYFEDGCSDRRKASH